MTLVFRRGEFFLEIKGYKIVFVLEFFFCCLLSIRKGSAIKKKPSMKTIHTSNGDETAENQEIRKSRN